MARPPKEVLILDMPFSEALERYAGTKPKEVRVGVARAKKKAIKKEENKS